LHFVFQPLIIVGTILELVVTRLALKISKACAEGIEINRVPTPKYVKFFTKHRSLVLELIHFFLYQNVYQMAIFVWIGVSKLF
jgi:hypothetical protein